jgi:ABC-type cobalamin/Fe3+-siderophores transport system ATPase subunit
MDTLSFCLEKMQDLTVLYGQNGSGKTRLLKRLASKLGKEHQVLFLDAMAYKAVKKNDIRTATIPLAMKHILSKLDGIKGKNAVVLIDNAGILDSEQMGRIYAKLHRLIIRKKVWKAVVARNSDKFSVPALRSAFKDQTRSRSLDYVNGTIWLP